jgi:nucleoside-diphosphate-sugar epimerase
MPHTLVTGANSFVAAHVIANLISKGHKVTGSLRRAASGDAILSEHPEWKGRLDFVEVADYAEPGAWDEIFKAQEFDYIEHIASPMYADAGNTDYDKHWLKPGVDG